MSLENDPASKTELVPGQLWEIGEFHIEIVQLGKTLCHYRHLRNLNQKGVPLRIEQRRAVEKYLKQKKAKMVGNRKTMVRNSRAGSKSREVSPTV